MTLCENCIHARGCPGTWYDPPEYWCDKDREEYDMEDSEVAARLEEEYGDEDAPFNYEWCDDYEEAYFEDPDPDRAFDEYRDRMSEAGLDWRHLYG